MRTLISGLMEYTRINRKENIVLSDLNLLLKDVQEDLTDRINNYNAIVSIKELPTINCYPTFVRILFQNLISNAIKFTHKDSTPIINISCRERNSDWLFLVEDNGIGINFKDVDEIFLIFKRLHNEKTYSGSGIGLAHCKKIVEIHNGEIWVESVVGKGSIFNFTISKNI
jgi:light-regulated signal transduction histidine kinase (bacteriophytochrome)